MEPFGRKARPGRASIAPFRRQQRSWPLLMATNDLNSESIVAIVAIEIRIDIWSMFLWRWFDLLTSERDDSSFPIHIFCAFLASCASSGEMHRMVLGSLVLRRVATFVQSLGKILHRGIRTHEASERVKGDNRVWQLWQTPWSDSRCLKRWSPLVVCCRIAFWAGGSLQANSLQFS